MGSKAIKIILIGLITVSAPSSTYADNLNFDYQPMRTFLEDLRHKGQLPDRNTGMSLITQDDESNSLETQELFATLQKSIFGSSDLIKLKSCKTCEALADYDSRIVYVQPSFIQKLQKEYGSSAIILNKFILSHELSHFVQEASIGHGKDANASLNGLPSLFQGEIALESENLPSHLAHAEVDIYALLILRNFENLRPLVILDLFDKFIQEAKDENNPESTAALNDFKVRKAKIRQALNELWP